MLLGERTNCLGSIGIRQLDMKPNPQSLFFTVVLCLIILMREREIKAFSMELEISEMNIKCYSLNDH